MGIGPFPVLPKDEDECDELELLDDDEDEEDDEDEDDDEDDEEEDPADEGAATFNRLLLYPLVNAALNLV